MTNKPAAFSQLKLRLTEAERRDLEVAAERNGYTLNQEVRARIQQRSLLDVWRLAEDVRRYLGPLIENGHELAKANDVASLTEALIDLVQPLLAIGVIDGPTAHEIRAIIERYSVVKRMIAIELAQRARQMRTGGGKL